MSYPDARDGTLKIKTKTDYYQLRLYAAGASVNSVKAIKNVKDICETYLKDNYDLEIIDIYQQPLMAEEDQIVALPLLIRKYPLPERRFIGDMSNVEVILRGLDIKSY